MSGTNTYRAKKALLDGIEALLGAEPTTDEVKVTYAYRGHEHERELVHGGRAFGSQSYPVSSGIGEFPRDEDLTIKLYVVIDLPGCDQEEVELRAVAIGTRIETWIATTASLPGFDPGEVTSVGIGAIDLDSDADDDGALATLEYDVTISTRIS